MGFCGVYGDFGGYRGHHGGVRRVVEHARPVVYDDHEYGYDEYGHDFYDDDVDVVEVVGDSDVLVEQYHGTGEEADGEIGTYATSGEYSTFIGKPTRLMYRRLAPARRVERGRRVVYTEEPRRHVVRDYAPRHSVVRHHAPRHYTPRHGGHGHHS